MTRKIEYRISIYAPKATNNSTLLRPQMAKDKVAKCYMMSEMSQMMATQLSNSLRMLLSLAGGSRTHEARMKEKRRKRKARHHCY